MSLDSMQPTAIPLQAIQLLGRWKRYCGDFKPFEPSCSCCMGLGIASVEALEVSLLAFVADKHVTDEAVRALLRDAAGYVPGEAGSVMKLLEALGRRATTAPLTAQQQVLATIDSALAYAEAEAETPRDHAGSP